MLIDFTRRQTNDYIDVRNSDSTVFHCHRCAMLHAKIEGIDFTDERTTVTTRRLYWLRRVPDRIPAKCSIVPQGRHLRFETLTWTRRNGHQGSDEPCCRLNECRVIALLLLPFMLWFMTEAKENRPYQLGYVFSSVVKCLIEAVFQAKLLIMKLFEFECVCYEQQPFEKNHNRDIIAHTSLVVIAFY